MDLLRNGTFRNLWAANTISTFGTMFGALTLTALIYLDASPVEMGFLAAASSLPVLLFAVAAGVWIDRLPRVGLMVVADLGRFVTLMTVPLAAITGHLAMPQLYIVAFIVGGLNVVFDIAFRSALPEFMPPERIVDANSALGMGESAAATASPAAGGAIAQTIGGPVAVLVDAATFFASGLFISRMAPSKSGSVREHKSAVSEASEGLRTVTRDALLRAVFGMVVTYSFFSGFIVTLYGLWIIDGLEFSAFTLGLLLASGGAGTLVGAWASAPLARRLGLGHSIVVTYLTASALSFLTPLAGGPVLIALGMLFTEQCVGDAFWTMHNIHATSLRQMVVPADRLGRVNAAFLLARQGLRPLGALVAGAVAASIGVGAGLLISCAGISVAGLWLVLSPLALSGDEP